MRPPGVVFEPKGVDRCLGFLQVGPDLHVVEQFALQLRWNRSSLPMVVGERGFLSRCVMPFSRQIRSNITSPPPRLNRAVNCLPLSVSTSSGTPNRCRASTKAWRPTCCRSRDTSYPQVQLATVELAFRHEMLLGLARSLFALPATAAAGGAEQSAGHQRRVSTPGSRPQSSPIADGSYARPAYARDGEPGSPGTSRACVSRESALLPA